MASETTRPTGRAVGLGAETPVTRGALGELQGVQAPANATGSSHASQQPPPLAVTRFPDKHATSAARYVWPWGELLRHYREAREYPSKGDCPLLQFGEIGTHRTERGCLRSIVNTRFLSCAVGDVDRAADEGRITFDLAVEILRERNLRALVVTTYTGPRFRVVAPLASPVDCAALPGLVDALNGALGNVLASESWKPAMSFYVGRVRGVPYRVEETHGDLLDTRDDLPRIGLPVLVLVPAEHRAPRAPREGASVIEAFNEQADLVQMLERYGFVVMASGRVLKPDAKAGHEDRGCICSNGERVYLPSDNDNPRAANEKSLDPFDLFVMFEHGGDVRAATREAARLLNLGRP